MRQVGHGGTSSPRCPTNGGRGRRPRRPRAGVRIAAGAAALAALVLLPARSGVAYRFYTTYRSGSGIPTLTYAARWNEADFPVRFRLLDNNLARNWPPEVMRPLIEEMLAEWNVIPTSALHIELARDTLRADRTGYNGINEIGFDDMLPPSGPRAGAALSLRNSDNVYECDVALNPEAYSSGRTTELVADMRYVLMHEVGHCLGLAHSEAYPIPDWAEGVPPTYYPPPVMAYTWNLVAGLAEDDRIGTSLLYPTPAFARSRGAVAGRVVAANGFPARFVYIQALGVRGETGFGPGAFANENGYFVLEGLPPGPVLLWVHPMLNYAADPHPRLRSPSPSAGATAIRDQWRWVTVTAAETTVIPVIGASTGRQAASR